MFRLRKGDNAFTTAIRTVAEILQDYDHDKQVLGLVFGTNRWGKHKRSKRHWVCNWHTKHKVLVTKMTKTTTTSNSLDLFLGPTGWNQQLEVLLKEKDLDFVYLDFWQDWCNTTEIDWIWVADIICSLQSQNVLMEAPWIHLPGCQGGQHPPLLPPERQRVPAQLRGKIF